MIYLFEDQANSTIPRFFISCYNNDPSVCIVEARNVDNINIIDWTSHSVYIVFSNGDRNLNTITRKLLKITNHNICVYLDLLPDNQSTCEIYNFFSTGLSSFKGRILVMPIASIEYIYISFIHDAGLSCYDDEAQDILSKKRYENSAFCKRTKISPKNYESYMKQFCSVGLKECAQVKRSQNWKSIAKRAEYMFIFTDCICKKQIKNHICHTYSLLDKKREFLNKFPGVPAIDSDGLSIKRTQADLLNVHTTLVTQYNDWVTSFYSNPSTRKKYYINGFI